ncbi:MAG: 5-(carboxyamino)imidazole ribonucleotide synthase [Armatimonadetes bacterium]|nr:5-(carboxyamino)imidazole ribonucleotide synthase [Armatimonadota bacterium]
MAKYRLGILGGGQLARMSVMAAQRMGVSVVSLDEDPESPAAQVGPAITGSIHDADAIARLMTECEFVTFENEFIRADTLRSACEKVGYEPDRVVPGIDTLATIQDKLHQREAYERAGVPSPRAVSADLAEMIEFPCVLKARFGGYDGKGTRYAKTEEEYRNLESIWGDGGWLAEELVDFKMELAVMVATTNDGRYDAFPTMVTLQTNYVCDLVYPCFDAKIALRAQHVAIEAVKAVKGKGLFGVELFLESNGEVKVNEIAPRPHNTGHYTLDWGGTSQFEAHVQVVIGCFRQAIDGNATCMANLLGVDEADDYARAFDSLTSMHPGVKMHWYGKKVSKPGRKMGHINVVDNAASYHPDNGDNNHIILEAKEARETFLNAWSKK